MSILNSVKTAIGLEPDYTEFDDDIIMHINSAFSILSGLGVGHKEGFRIVDSSTDWSAFYTDPRLDGIKTYVSMRVRSIFDPPTTSFAINANVEVMKELEFTLQLGQEEVDAE